VRVWQQPVDLLLACGLTVLPLAPVSDVKVEKLPRVLMAVSDSTRDELLSPLGPSARAFIGIVSSRKGSPKW